MVFRRMCMFAVVSGSLAGVSVALPRALGNEPAATESAAADEIAPPDMSKYDIETIRVMAKQFFLAMTDAHRELVTLKAQRDNATAERGKLAASLAQLEKDNADLRRQVRDLNDKLAAASRRDPGSDSAANPTRPTPNPPASTPTLTPREELSAIDKLIRQQSTDFKTLNAAPVKMVGQYFDLLGWAENSDHTSAKVFEDRGTPHKFLSFTNADGQRIFLSLPVQGNDALFKLIAARGKVALRVRVMGTSAKDDKPYEGAIQRWETLTADPPGAYFATPPPSPSKK